MYEKIIWLFEVHAENIVAYFKVLSRHLPGGNEECLSQDSGYLLSVSQRGYRFCQRARGKNFLLAKDDDDDSERIT
jgi:hypothetical protein